MVEKSLASSSLGDVIDRILDKGIVVDLWAITFLALDGGNSH